MRKVLICTVCIILVADNFLEKPTEGFESVRPEYSISTNENPNARHEFELRQVINPKTRQLPKEIRKKELRFSQSHLTRGEFASLRGDDINEESWESLGPFNVGGRTRAVAIDVTDPTENTILAGGVSGGVWKTTDGGATWRRTSDPELRNSVTAIVQDTRAGKENIWYYGTGELLGNSARGGAAPYRGDGIFKSIDGGESWFQLESTQDSDPSVFGSQFQYTWRLVIDHTDQENDVLLAATYGAILKSIDGGNSWVTELGVTLNNLPDGTDLNESNAPFYTDIIQTEAGYFYAFLSDQTSINQPFIGSGVFFSTDADTWHSISGPTGVFQTERGVLDALGNDLYFFFNTQEVVTENGEQTSVDSPQLFKSRLTNVDEFGIPTGSWTELTDNLPEFEELGEFNVQGGYNMMVKIMPTNPNVVLLGATNLYRSTNGFSSGNNTEWVGGYNPDEEGGNLYPNHHPDQHDIIFFEGNANKVLSANDGGLQISNNILASDVQWISLNRGFITSQFYTIDIPKSNDSNIVTGGLQDNGTHLTQSTGSDATWNLILGGDGSFSASVPFNLHWYFSFQNSQIYRITFGEESSTFARVDPTGGAQGSDYLFINPYVLDPINANIMYLAGGNAIWKNKNLSQIKDGSQETTSLNWEIIEESLIPQPEEQGVRRLITALEVSRNSEYLYFGTSDNLIYRLNDPSKRNPSEVIDLSSEDLPGGYVSCIASNPENDDEVITVFSNYGIPSLFHSTNAGSSWTSIGGNLEEFADGTGNGPSIRWAEIVPLVNGTRYFVGTSVGLYSTDELDGDATVWVKESPEAIGKSVIRMMDYRPLDGRLVVATHGNGVFTTNVQGFKQLSPISPNAPEKLNVTNAFPNPFSESIEIEIEIPETNYVRIDIYDTGGNFVKNLFYNVQFSGNNVVSWDGSNQKGYKVPPGMYFYRLYYGGKVESGRVVYTP